MEWISGNSDALMVMITAIYVGATILICVFNAKSASAAKKQIEKSQEQLLVSQTQQKQNVGIQLYEKRKAVLKAFHDKKYNDIYWDIPILFDDAINKVFQNVCGLANEKIQVQQKISYFERNLRESWGDSVYKEYTVLVTNAEQCNDYIEVYKFCRKYAFTEFSVIENAVIKYDFEALNERAMDLNREIAAKHLSVFAQMQEFIRTSLTVEV